MLNVAVAGSTGRMGRTLIEAIAQAQDMRLSAALDRSGNPGIGKDAGEFLGASCGVHISDDPAKALPGSQVLIDFTRPDAALPTLPVFQAMKTK